MAEMLGSAVVQEGVSRAVSFVLGKREEKASQGHLVERLQMAANEIQHAFERTKNWPITSIALLQHRKMIKRAYIEAMDLLDHNNKRQEVPVVGQEQTAQGVKRKRSWFLGANKNLTISSSAGLNTDDVRRFEWFSECARKFVRDMESGYSLCHNNSCNPILRHVLEGKTLRCQLEQGNQVRWVHIWRVRSDEERGVEAVLRYRCHAKESTIMQENNVTLQLTLRLSESTDIVGVTIKALQLLSSHFKLGAASAIMEELMLLPTLVHDTAPSYAHCLSVDSFKTSDALFARILRPDPACCGARRNGVCSSNNVSSELSHMFPEEVNWFRFTSSLSSSFIPPEAATGRRISNKGWTTSRLLLSVYFWPHYEPDPVKALGIWATVSDGNVEERRDAGMQQVTETLESDAIDCFSRQPELTTYSIDWATRHGRAWFEVERRKIKRTKMRYNTRGSTKPSACQ